MRSSDEGAHAISDEDSLTGYADRLTLRPGERIRFRVGGPRHETSFAADIVRLRCADVQPGGAGFKEEPIRSAIDGQYRATVQRIDRGSRAVVPPAAALADIESFHTPGRALAHASRSTSTGPDGKLGRDQPVRLRALPRRNAARPL